MEVPRSENGAKPVFSAMKFSEKIAERIFINGQTITVGFPNKVDSDQELNKVDVCVDSTMEVMSMNAQNLKTFPSIWSIRE